MRKILLFILLVLNGIFQAQENQKLEVINMSKEQRREYMKTLSPEQRKALLGEAMLDAMVKKIEISSEKQEVFKKTYQDFKKSQKVIKEKFKSNIASKNMTDEQAKTKLYQNFELGQALLDNRKAYTEKFLKIISPKQVMKLFEEERKMRQQYMNRMKKMSSPEQRRTADVQQ